MAIIAIFCDGTWNRFDSKHPTHVARLAQACAQRPDQKVLYFEGVGTGTGLFSELGRWLSMVGGGLFGWGLNRNIKAAYLSLCRVYTPGDKIMLFGFSRGAYTVRSLVGMIRECGVLSDPTTENVDRASRLYRSRGPKNVPDAPHVKAARRDLSPHFATSAEDVMARSGNSYLVRITYLGVWDTVGVLGIPKSVLGRLAALWNSRYAFHDTSLSHLVEKARHAVALDEERVFFAPSLWDNLEPAGTDPGLNRADQSAERYYQQVWFPGNHSIVGGSAPPDGLTAASLAWIWASAKDSGLTLKSDHAIPTVLVDAVSSARDIYTVNSAYRFLPWLQQWRKGPSAPHELHPTARLRATLAPEYRPGSLRRVLPGLFRRK